MNPFDRSDCWIAREARPADEWVELRDLEPLYKTRREAAATGLVPVHVDGIAPEMVSWTAPRELWLTYRGVTYRSRGHLWARQAAKPKGPSRPTRPKPPTKPKY